ncbi:hypothetical protein O1L55_01795 [Streptomyces albulus]|nr:hypothetical protein [Streptomyces noursei]
MPHVPPPTAPPTAAPRIPRHHRTRTPAAANSRHVNASEKKGSCWLPQPCRALDARPRG